MGLISASDRDLGANSVLTYTVISDWANDVFSLNPQTGVFTLTARLDYEEVSNSCSALLLAPLAEAEAVRRKKEFSESRQSFN